MVDPDTLILAEHLAEIFPERILPRFLIEMSEGIAVA
jgi:hypothetical protein